jgi:hypothetical protein
VVRALPRVASERVFRVVAWVGVRYKAALITRVEVCSSRRSPNRVVPETLPWVTFDTVTEVEG